MALRLQIISRHRQGLGERSAMEFGHSGGTIGRSLESDWVLPDAQRYLSSRHASIDYRSGSYYIVDSSTNGVYVNDAEQPVGRGNPQRLFPGDRIRIGEYEMSVEIAGEAETDSGINDDQHVDPVTKAQRVPPPDPTRADMVAPHEITAVGIEMLISDEVEIGQLQRIQKANAAALRLEDDSPPAAKRTEPPPVSAAARIVATPKATRRKDATPQHAVAEPEQRPTKTPAVAPLAVATERPASPAPVPSGALDAFFRGAGLPPQKLDDKQAADLLHRLGQMTREVVVGVTENLHLRNEQKNVLRVPTTTIQPQSNNPLKFSADVEEALNNLLFRQSSQYLSGVDAIRETFADIRLHQQHLLGAVRKAIADYVGRLDPDELENKLSKGKHGAIINATNKIKYWDYYRDLYQLVVHSQPGQFPQQFLEELSRAYEQQDTRGATPAARNVKAG